MIDGLTSLTRPLVTIGLVAALIYGFLIGRIGGEQFFTVVTMVVGFWFGQRQIDKVPTPKNGTDVQPTPEAKP